MFSLAVPGTALNRVGRTSILIIPATDDSLLQLAQRRLVRRPKGVKVLLVQHNLCHLVQVIEGPHELLEVSSLLRLDERPGRA
jgi:hypothetical protein